MSRRVILDTSTLVSAALRVGSVPHQALQQALATCTVCASTETLAELDRVLGLKKFDRYLDRDLRQSFTALIRRNSRLFALSTVDFPRLSPACRDPGDTMFLALALAAEAEMLISSDQDLLVMHPWNSLVIVTPAVFLAGSPDSSPADEPA
jgi:putative PIN family toxin of toxin-antitoxin system